MLSKSLLLLFLAFSAAVGTAQAAIIVSSVPSSNTLQPLGYPNTTTYGQVFTTPDAVNTQLDSFSFFISGGPGDLYAGVAPWTGTGAGAAMFTSAVFNAAPSGATEFVINAGGLLLNSGTEYVAYFSTAGLTGSTFIMRLGTGASNAIGLAWDNADGAAPNGRNWNGCTPAICGQRSFAYNMQFDVPGAQIPEPASLALMVLGLAGLAARRRRKQ